MQYVIASKDAKCIMTLAHNQAKKILAAAPHLTYRAALQQALKRVHALFKFYCALEQAFNEWHNKVLAARRCNDTQTAGRVTCNYKQALGDGYYAIAECDGYNCIFYWGKYQRPAPGSRLYGKIERCIDSHEAYFNFYLSTTNDFHEAGKLFAFEHAYYEWLA